MDNPQSRDDETPQQQAPDDESVEEFKQDVEEFKQDVEEDPSTAPSPDEGAERIRGG